MGYYKKKPKERLVRCIELDMCFETTLQAYKVLGIDYSSISKACRGLRQSAGKHPITGDKLHWEYVKIKQEEI